MIDFRIYSTKSYCWSAALIGGEGRLNNGILWFRTRREAKAYARSNSYAGRIWMIGRRVDATSRECAP